MSCGIHIHVWCSFCRHRLTSGLRNQPKIVRCPGERPQPDFLSGVRVKQVRRRRAHAPSPAALSPCLSIHRVNSKGVSARAAAPVGGGAPPAARERSKEKPQTESAKSCVAALLRVAMLRRRLTQKSSYVARCSVGMWQQLEVTCVGQLNRVQLGTGPHAALATTAGAAIGKRIAREKKGPLAKAFNEQLAAIPKFHGVIGSALLERLPVVMPEPEQWQVDYAAWKEQRDRMKTKDTSEYLEQILSENRPTIRSEEDEEMSRAEKLYEPAPRETEVSATQY